MSRLHELLRQVRAGDEAAAAEFYHTYEPHVRRIVRARMRVARLRRVSDSSDLCQAVLASFLVRAVVGQYEIADSDELKALLARIAANKVADLARKPEFHDPLVPVAGPGVEGIEPVAPGSGPASQLAWREILEKAQGLLTEGERCIAALRKEGLSWDQVAQRLGKSAGAARKTLERAMARILRQLGLEELNDE
jgi:RNA polymerase sigma-70 factor (ECF subfamily)